MYFFHTNVKKGKKYTTGITFFIFRPVASNAALHLVSILDGERAEQGTGSKAMYSKFTSTSRSVADRQFCFRTVDIVSHDIAPARGTQAGYTPGLTRFGNEWLISRRLFLSVLNGLQKCTQMPGRPISPLPKNNCFLSTYERQTKGKGMVKYFFTL